MVYDLNNNRYYNYKIHDEKKDLIDLVLGAFRSIRRPVAYVSMSITTGKIMYDVLEEKGCKNLDELSKFDKEAVYKKIIKPNIEMGIQAADNINSTLPPLAPSIFEAKKFRWNQEEYMDLWFKVIEERAREMHMTDGWEYSNGGVKEFTKSMQMYHKFNIWNKRFSGLSYSETKKIISDMSGIKVFDLNGDRLFLEEGYNMINNAISDLEKRGFDPSSLKESKKELNDIIDFLHDPLINPKTKKEHQLYSSSINYLTKHPSNY